MISHEYIGDFFINIIWYKNYINIVKLNSKTLYDSINGT